MGLSSGSGPFGGETVFDTVGAKLPDETAYQPVHSVPEKDLRHDLLERSDTQIRRPHEGEALCRSLRVGDRLEDAVWTYREPIAPAGLICFFNERVDLEVDGEAQERPATQWSR